MKPLLTRYKREKKVLPYGAKVEVIRKAIKGGRKFFIHTYVGVLEIWGIDNNHAFTGKHYLQQRTWAICSTHVDRWYEEFQQTYKECLKGKKVKFWLMEGVEEKEKYNSIGVVTEHIIEENCLTVEDEAGGGLYYIGTDQVELN